ncbi:MAG: DNA mismatch repair protein MutS [Pseudomonadota bacterium]
MRRPPAETPLMRQYLEVKQRYPDSIVFFRLGDFYEMFFDDALVAAKELDLTLTTRDKGREDAVPMCGVPHHSSRGYVGRLCELGHKVVICEQMEDPSAAKGIVRREVTRVVTPGIVLDEEMLDAKSARYLAGFVTKDESVGLAYLDVSTGDFRCTQLAARSALLDELSRVDPREIVAPVRDLADAANETMTSVRGLFRNVAYTPVEPSLFDDQAARDSECLAELAQTIGSAPGELGLDGMQLAARAAVLVLRYARNTQPAGALPIVRLVVYRPEETLVLDEASKTNLEILETIVGRKKQGSLLGVLDETCTSLGGRLLRKWLLFPLVDVARIRRRQDAVEFLVERAALRAELRARLAKIADLERICGRIKLSVATPRDLVALGRSLAEIPAILALLADEASQTLAAPEILAFSQLDVGVIAAVAESIARTLVDDPPLSSRDGGLVRAGCSAEIDELRSLASGGKEAIIAIETRERERTGSGSLKVRYNRVFGYYLEITKANLKSVPSDYMRKQTLTNAERFTTPELADLEARVLAAEERLQTAEAEAFEALRLQVGEHAQTLLAAADLLATLDVCASLAEVAHRSSYVRPAVDAAGGIDIVEGRHPVVEKLAAAGGFVPNDCRLDPATEQILVVTGPNMAGKSTFLRQVAQIVLMAQTGSFVPAARATIGVVDRIFTRVGASDNLARGESTFMVEMKETASICRHATRKSLIVLDEIGRGTSTYDGVSIAWAVAEYLHDAVGAKSLFATHYHELTSLSQHRARVSNVSVAVREHEGQVVFLRKVVAGAASRSYGIEVARLAGLPRSVVARARQILAQLERPVGSTGRPIQLALLPQPSAAPSPSPSPAPAESPSSPMPAPSPSPPVVPPSSRLPLPEVKASRSPVEAALANLDLDRLTPLESLQALFRLKQLL